MAEINDGGPAFPVNSDEYDHNNDRWRPRSEGGMTLRDYFAAKAMQAQLITDGQPGEAAESLIEAAFNARQDPVYRLALNSYSVADAMIRAREGGT